MHFWNGVRASNRSRRIVVREVTAIKRQAQVSQAKVNGIADYVVDDHRSAAHTETFVHKLAYLARFQMMNEQAATD